MADSSPDDWLFNGAPVSAAPAPTAAPVAQSLRPPPQPALTPPPLPDESGLNLITRAAIAEGDANNPDSQRAVAGVILRRMQDTGKTAAQVLSEPGQFESYGNGRIQAVDPSSPQFTAAQNAIKDVTAGPYDSFYQPTIVAQRGVTPPFDPKAGTMIGTQLFGNRTGGATTPAPGTDDASWQKFIAPLTGGAPSVPGADQPGSKAQFNFGPGFGALSAAAVPTYQRILKERAGGDLDTMRTADPGSAQLPYYIQQGSVAPSTAGLHWVDVNGVEHINPGGTLENIGSALAGFGQGLGMDTAASLNRLSGGGFAGGDPTYAAFAQGQGEPSAFDLAQASKQGFSQQQRQYALEHLGDPFAQTGRFFGQAVPATAAAVATPEIEAPAALGTGGRIAATGLTNALRGVAATAPSVGTNSAPVAQQLATGAAAGVIAPLVTGTGAKAIQGLTGLGREVSPEVASLAQIAQDKYGIPLRAGQVMGANGDRAAATADSNMLTSNPKALANNQAQKQAFMRGMTGSYGDASGDVSPDAMKAARANVVAPLNEAATRTSISPQAADAVQTRIGQIIGDAQQVLPDNEVKPLLNMAQAIGDVRGANGISGKSYQALTRSNAPLDRLESADNTNTAYYAHQIHDALNDGLAASSAPEDVEAVRNARWQYKNLMTVAKIAPKADANGFVSPSLLRGAVASQFENQAFEGAGNLGELARIGQTFLKEPPNSGTPSRLADLALPTLVSGAIGAGADTAAFLLHHPEGALGTLASGALGGASKVALDAIKRNKIAGSASGIIQRSLPGAPGSAFSGIGNAAKSLEIPLSALAGVRGIGAIPANLGQPQPAVTP